MAHTLEFTLLAHIDDMAHPERLACDALDETCDQLATVAFTEWFDGETREGIDNLCPMHAAEWLAARIDPPFVHYPCGITLRGESPND
jgi:hypothetical protein